ncbi:MAG: aldo/keto reductase [Tannerellaceae bacterium]|nr:aldo/keto reductase [Tannerellaceae bacterium]
MNRRKFIKTGVAGLAGITVAGGISAAVHLPGEPGIDKVKLGNSGLTVSRLAMGTGSVGGNKASNQTRLGMDKFVELARHAYDCGIRFYDTADSYGSVPYIGEAIQSLPRENITWLTKIWTSPDGSPNLQPVGNILDRLRKEGQTEYFDVVLLHCMMQAGWSNDRKHYIEGLSRAKEDGIVKAVGVSCHSYDALVEAAESPWVDVIMARINPFQSKMDGTPESINDVLGLARRNGKGIIAMKVFGEGLNVKDDEREQSFRYLITEANVHCMTLGLENMLQMDDAVEKVKRIVQTARK